MRPSVSGLALGQALAFAGTLFVTIAAAGGVACGPSYQVVYEADVNFEHCYALDERSDVPLVRKRDCWQGWRTRYSAGQPRDKAEYAMVRAEALSRGSAVPTDESMMAAAPGVGSTSQVVAPETTNAFAPPPKTLDDDDGGVELQDVSSPAGPLVTWDGHAKSQAGAPGKGNGAGDSPAGPFAPDPPNNPSSQNGQNNSTNSPAGPPFSSGQTSGKRSESKRSGRQGAPATPGSSCTSACTTHWGECRDTCKGAACTSCDGGYRTCMRACFK